MKKLLTKTWFIRTLFGAVTLLSIIVGGSIGYYATTWQDYWLLFLTYTLFIIFVIMPIAFWLGRLREGK